MSKTLILSFQIGGVSGSTELLVDYERCIMFLELDLHVIDVACKALLLLDESFSDAGRRLLRLIRLGRFQVL